jgi:hypothetical protein
VQDTNNRRLRFSPHVEFIPECFGTVTKPRQRFGYVETMPRIPINFDLDDKCK